MTAATVTPTAEVAQPRPAPAGGSGRWVRAAGCADPELDPLLRDVFTADDRTPWDAQAIRVCRACPVRVDCDAYAATLGPVTGIWGGWRHLDRYLVHPDPPTAPADQPRERPMTATATRS